MSGPKRLSLSAASVFEECPRKWKFRYIDRRPVPSNQSALVGSFAHEVLEFLFNQAPATRTVEAAKTLAKSLWPAFAESEDFAALGLTEDEARAFRWESWLAVEGLWRLEKPEAVDVQATEQRLKVNVGTVPFVGVVDRLDRIESGLDVVDYKSGNYPAPRYRDKARRQILLYCAAVESETGERPVRGRLLYLRHKPLNASPTDRAIGRTVEWLEGIWRQIGSAKQANTFEAKPSPLCWWCPHATDCPEGREALIEQHANGKRYPHATVTIEQIRKRVQL